MKKGRSMQQLVVPSPALKWPLCYLLLTVLEEAFEVVPSGKSWPSVIWKFCHLRNLIFFFFFFCHRAFLVLSCLSKTKPKLHVVWVVLEAASWALSAMVKLFLCLSKIKTYLPCTSKPEKQVKYVADKNIDFSEQDTCIQAVAFLCRADPVGLPAGSYFQQLQQVKHPVPPGIPQC